MRDQGLKEAIRAAGGVSELARQLGISQPSVSNWTRVPAERVVAVEAATRIDRAILRPDLFGAAGHAADELDEVDAARAQRIRAARDAALRARRMPTCFSGFPICAATRRRSASRMSSLPKRRARSSVATRRARIFRSLHRPRPQRADALRLLLPHRLPARASAGAAARRSRDDRHRARRRSGRAGRSRGASSARSCPGLTAGACRRRPDPNSRFSRNISRPGSAVSSPISSVRTARISTGASERSAACSSRSKQRLSALAA